VSASDFARATKIPKKARSLQTIYKHSEPNKTHTLATSLPLLFVGRKKTLAGCIFVAGASKLQAR